ncbi:MAG: SurA N-terminal domain-containing protein [Victivallales bacterium]|nr:SurA N-terminal domain-containing protein [Victivallales bacterium]
MRNIHISLLLVFLGLSSFSQYGDSVLAMVGKKVITSHEVSLETREQELALARQYKGEELQQKISELRRSTLDTLIDHELCYLEFQEMKAKVPTDYLQRRINAMVEQHANGSVEKFEEQLQAQGTNMKEFKEKLEKNIAVMMLVNEKTNRGNIISDHEIVKFYMQNQAKFATAPEYRIEVILLRKEGRYENRLQETVDEIYGKLREGTPFADLAKQYSEGANAANGGDQGWLKQPNEALLNVIKTMKVGQTASKPVEIGSGLYIVRLADLKEGGIPTLDAELKKQIREILTKEESTRRYTELIKELYMRYRVRRFDATP